MRQDLPLGRIGRRPVLSAERIAARITSLCAFSLSSRITQRDATTGRDAPGSCTLLHPGARDRNGQILCYVHGRPAAARNRGLLDGPGCVCLPAPDRPGSAGARPSRSPVLEPGGIRASRQGSRSPPAPCPSISFTAKGRSPCGMHDERERSAPRQSKKTRSAA